MSPGVSTGRPRATSDREDRLLLRECQRNRTASAETLRRRWQHQIQTRVSRATVNNRLLERGLKARRPAKKPFLSRENKRKRLQWARDHEKYQLRHWRHVLFSDESRFLLYTADGRVTVRRQVGQRFNQDCIIPTRAHGGGSVHVWGAIHYGGKLGLVVLEGNVNAASYQLLLEEEMVPYAGEHFGRNFLFMLDNVPAQLLGKSRILWKMRKLKFCHGQRIPLI